MGSSRVAIIAGAGTLGLVAVGVAIFLSGPQPSPALPAAAPRATPAESTSAPLPAPLVTSSPQTKAAGSQPKASSTVASRTADPSPVTTPTTGTLRIDSDVPDTSVFIDRNYLGNAPVTAAALTPGRHHLNMSATGYDGLSEDIDVEAGTHDLSIKFKEIRLDVKIGVVHKHAFGSCTGTLSATPQGLRYDTTNADDAFVALLTDIETFEVDYLNKNLRVKIRRGKTYNFTDPDGNADRLFIFHRDVDKARQRLLGAGGDAVIR